MPKRRITPVGWVALIAMGLLLPAAAVTVGLLTKPVATLGVVAVLAVFAVSSIMSRQNNRSLFLASRSPMSNEYFAAAVGVRPEDGRLCGTIRAALAEGYESLSPEMLRPWPCPWRMIWVSGSPRSWRLGWFPAGCTTAPPPSGSLSGT